jgi:predicted acetyltransferase
MINSIRYKQTKIIDLPPLMNLYTDANWTNYTKNPQTLLNAISNSTYVLSVWNNDELIGLIRAVSDRYTILYIQDIIVLNKWKRHGIGSTLVKKTIKKFNNVRQIVLLTDDTPITRKFYKSLNFESCDRKKLVSFIYKT